ncbi:TPA: hypothetical protein I9742_000138 [Serratia marcescens]|nr:hypothetical protein [Serratia marcescens]
MAKIKNQQTRAGTAKNGVFLIDKIKYRGFNTAVIQGALRKFYRISA